MLRPILLAVLLGSADALESSASSLSQTLSEVLVQDQDFSRSLENANANSNFYATWISGYSLRFESCHQITNFDADGVINQVIVKYKLCASDSCKASCRGPEYVVQGQQFVQAYMQAKMTAQEYRCETAKENCQYYCEKKQNGNRELAYYGYYDCESTCLTNGGNSDCVEDQNGNKDNVENELENYLECSALNVNGNNNNNNGVAQYYIGAYCASGGKAMYLGVFSDQTCSVEAPSGTYEKLSYYGTSLPYSKDSGKSLVSNECVSCKEQSEKNNGKYYQQDQDEVSEMCAQVYQESLKCEKSLSSSVTQNPDNNGCDFINNSLSRMENGKRRGSASVAFAWIFFLSTVALAAFCVYLMREKQRESKALLNNGGTIV